MNWNGHTVWAVSRYEDIKTATSHRSSAPKSLVCCRATHHTTVRRVNAMRPRIEEMANGFIDTMVAKGPPGDLVQDYALPIPSLVISLLLGVPYTDHHFFQSTWPTSPRSAHSSMA